MTIIHPLLNACEEAMPHVEWTITNDVPDHNRKPVIGVVGDVGGIKFSVRMFGGKFAVSLDDSGNAATPEDSLSDAVYRELTGRLAKARDAHEATTAELEKCLLALRLSDGQNTNNLRRGHV